MRGRLAVVSALLFGSGLCALVYQVVWLRMMRLIFGASTSASAAVLAIFMGGLGLGGILLGHRVDRHPRPLAFYAMLEVLITIAAATTPLLAWVAREAYIAAGGSLALGMIGATAVRLLLATLVLLVPTVLMGGTLPAAGRAVETAADLGRRNVAVLYGANTLGAVTGALLSTFWLLERFGAQHTLWLACTANFVIGLSGLALARVFAAPPAELVPPTPPHATHPAKGRSAPAAETAGPPRRVIAPAWFVCFAAAVVGFAFFLMELVWYRMLGPLLGGSSYTFGLILAVALTGIGLGGAFYALTRPGRAATIRGFAMTCVLEAVCIAIPFALGDWIALFTQATRPLGTIGFYGLVLSWAQVAAAVVLPAAFISGVQFPLLVALLGHGGERVGRHVGLAYAWNTLGSIGGSLAGGFWLLTALSAPGTWRLVVVVLVVLAGLALVISYVREGPAPGLAVALVAAVGAVVLLQARGPTAAWRHSPIGAGRAELGGSMNDIRNWADGRRRVVAWEVDGVESSVAIDSGGAISFVVNGKSDGSAIADGPTQVMGGLIGAILHPAPRRAFVIGLGTGSTAGWLGVVPTMERVDVVELEPAIREVARRCAPVNQNVLANPKVHLFTGDAREVLQTTRERYDIIFSEPSNPYRAGIASLFTREFYEGVASRLAAGGIFIQWVQSYEVDSQTVRTIYATLHSVFPVIETYESQKNDLMLVASMAPRTYDVPALRARVAQEPYQSALTLVWHASGLEGFLGRFLANPHFADVVAAGEGDHLNTDDMTRVEYGFARGVGRGEIFSNDVMWRLAHRLKADRPASINGEVDWNEVLEQRVAQYIAVEEAPPPLLGEPPADLQQRIDALTRYFIGDATAAYALWREQPREPIYRTELTLVASALADDGDEDALKYIEQIRAIDATDADAVLAHLRWKRGEPAVAVAALEAAFQHYRSDPWATEILMRDALTIATEIAPQDERFAQRLHRALQRPFVVTALNDLRLVTAVTVSAYTGDQEQCIEALIPFEPHTLWNADFLDLRLTCYQGNGHPRAVQAEADLALFNSYAAVPFARGFEGDHE